MSSYLPKGGDTKKGSSSSPSKSSSFDDARVVSSKFNNALKRSSSMDLEDFGDGNQQQQEKDDVFASSGHGSGVFSGLSNYLEKTNKSSSHNRGDNLGLGRSSTHSFASSNDSVTSESSIANQVDRFRTYKPQSTSMFLAPADGSSSAKKPTTPPPTAKTRPTPAFLTKGAKHSSKGTDSEEKPTRTFRSKKVEKEGGVDGKSFALPGRSKSSTLSPSATTSRPKVEVPKRSKSNDNFDLDISESMDSSSNKTKQSWWFNQNKDNDDVPTPVLPPSKSIAGGRRIVSLDIDPDDENWQFKLFPEPTSIEYTPEFDHVADKVYESRHRIRIEPKPELPPGVSGYNFEKILEEEESDEPPAPPILGGIFGDYMAERRKLAQWQARLASRGKMSLRIQCLVRRFLARLVYLEKVRLREMEKMRQRIKDIQMMLEEIRREAAAEMATLNEQFEERRRTERIEFFENFKAGGRRDMLETRKMVAMGPQLHRQSKRLKAKQQEIQMEIEKASKQNEELESQNTALQLEASNSEKLIEKDITVLAKTEHDCHIESTLRKVYENGLDRILDRIGKAVPDDVEFVDSLRDMATFCLETSKMRHAPVQNSIK